MRGIFAFISGGLFVLGCTFGEMTDGRPVCWLVSVLTGSLAARSWSEWRAMLRDIWEN